MSRKYFNTLVSRQYDKKIGFNSYFYNFSADYDASVVEDILDIHKYLMEKNNMI